MTKAKKPIIPVNDAALYNEKKKADWIEWAEKEIAEYKNFIKFLKSK